MRLHGRCLEVMKSFKQVFPVTNDISAPFLLTLLYVISFELSKYIVFILQFLGFLLRGSAPFAASSR